MEPTLGTSAGRPQLGFSKVVAQVSSRAFDSVKPGSGGFSVPFFGNGTKPRGAEQPTLNR